MTPSTPGNTSGLFYEAAPSTWHSSSGDPTSAWCNNETDLLGVASMVTGTGAMDGAAKTTVMLGVCTTGAANLADAYTVTVNGVVYGDWFLPSKGELNQMYVNKVEIGGLRAAAYWSSSEADFQQAWYQGFSDGSYWNDLKMTTLYVRPVRAFAATLLTCADGGVCAVGDTGPGGGKVFYVQASGMFACGATLASTCKYLEAAPTSGTAAWTDATYEWSGITNVAIGVAAQGTAIGTGYKNTQAMVTQSSTAGRAGTVTRAYRGPNSLSDWYLPSKDEMIQMHANKSVIGGFSNEFYWGSSEYDRNGVWVKAVGSGSGAQSLGWKDSPFYVRPVRAFGGTVACADGGVCAVGDTGPGGGKVFYVQASGTFACGATLSSTCKYLEAAPTSGTAAWTEATYAWSGNTSEAVGADAQGTAIGTGYRNTQAMVTQSSTAGMAGTVTRAYRGPNSLSDWYLPSKDELNQMYVNRSAIGGFTSNWHRSSSEYGDDSAWIQDFLSDRQAETFKSDDRFYVRPVRAF
jgi:hypothetical protein